MNAMNAEPKNHSMEAYSLLVRRNSFGAIKSGYPTAIDGLLKAVCNATGIETGIIERNKKGGYNAINIDIYGYDIDRNLIAIQIRQTWKIKETYFTNQRKYYALAGVDDGQIFCHAIPTSFRSIPDLDAKSPEEVVRWAEGKIFRVPPARVATIIRQGDVALIPVRSIPRVATVVQPDADGLSRLIVRESHNVRVDGILYSDQAGRRWADGLVQIDHEPGQHRSIDADGRFEIVAGEKLNVRYNTID